MLGCVLPKRRFGDKGLVPEKVLESAASDEDSNGLAYSVALSDSFIRSNNRFCERNIPRKRMSFRGGRSRNAQSLLETARTPTPGWPMMELLDSGSLSLFGGHEPQAHWRRHMECLAGGT